MELDDDNETIMDIFHLKNGSACEYDLKMGNIIPPSRESFGKIT